MLNRLTTLAVMLLASGAAHAAAFTDASNDFLPSYTGPQGADLDVRTTEASRNTSTGAFDFRATLGGDIGTTAGGFYVFGVNRGEGTARFGALAPGVLFDSVVVINQNRTGFARDLILGVTTNLSSSAITFDGASLRAVVSAGLLPSRGFAAANYTFNLWPRVAGGTNAISDFAPDNANLGFAAVPEPATWAMMIGGFAAVGAAARRRIVRPALI